jgi:EKC/KEOPS complex subunit CGI121/TPRKB
LSQIADAYRRWGVTPGKTKDLIVVKVVLSSSIAQGNASAETQTPQAIWDHLQQYVNGTPTPLTDAELAQATDWPKVRKYYRLNGVPALESFVEEQEKIQQSESLAIMGMALRGL